MKSSRYTQASSPNDNEYRDYQNIGITRLPDDGNKNIGPSYIDAHCHNVNNSSELLLKNNYEVFKTAESRNEINRENIALNNRSNQATENIELMCNCAIKEVVFPLKNKFKDFNSEQNVVLNRSFTSIPKLASTNLSQYSLDRRAGGGGKGPHPHRQQKHHVQTLQRNPSLKRIRSPEIINIHRAAVGQCPTSTVIYDDYAAAESYGAKVCPYDQEFKCDDYGFTRGPSFHSSTLRSTTSHGPHPMGQLPKRRAAGDGMDAEMDDPEIMLELSGHQMRADCHCPCSDHVLYSPNYTTCIHQDERMVPATAPDVTRRLGPVTPLGKVVADAQASPPYYRANSATSSSSNSSTSRIELSTRHWWIILIVLLFAAAAGVGVPIALKISSSASFDERLEFATRLLQEVPLIDGHNDLPWNIRKFLHNKLKDFNFNQNLKSVKPWSGSSWSHTDLVRLQQGHVAAQFWAAYVPCDSQYKDAVQLTLEQIDVIRRLTDMYHPPLTLCTSSQDILAAHKKHQLCSLIGVEGGHSLAGSLAVLRTLYHVGVRYLTLTSTCNTPWADCSFADLPGKKPEHGGLTDFGKTIIKEMNRLGMIVDLSHVSVRTMRDALDVSKAPVIFSHSSAHALCNSTRNVPDDTLRKLALNRGVVMVNFYSQFLTCKDVSGVQDAVAHINHIREVAGVDNVGLGAGYDGINFVPEGLKDVSSYPNLFAELIATGKWGVEDLKKLAGLNFLRVFEEVEKIRDEFKKANITPYEDVLVPKPGRENNCTSLPAV